MTRFFTAMLMSSIAFVAAGQDLKTDKDKTSYAVGVQMGKSLAAGKDFLDVDVLLMGLIDTFDGRKPALDEQEMRSLMQKWQTDSQAKQAADQSKEGTEFLEANGKKEGVITTDSGLQYEVLTKGAGASPSRTDSVKAHYRGTLIDGTQFDSSYERGTPFEARVTGVIAGWTEALMDMKEGEKRRLYIPYNLAYGARGAPPSIPPYATLIFEIELLQVIK